MPVHRSLSLNFKKYINIFLNQNLIDFYTCTFLNLLAKNSGILRNLSLFKLMPA